MKYIPLKEDQLNVSRTRFESISPSLKIDDRGHPNIAWLDRKEGHNELKFSFFDGLKWSYYDSTTIYISKEEITSSPSLSKSSRTCR